MKFAMLGVLALVGLATSTTAAAPLEPSGKWVLEGTESGCILSREFGTGSNKITVGIKRLPFSRSFTLLIVAPNVSQKPFFFGNASVVTGASGPWTGKYLSTPLGNGLWLSSAEISSDRLDQAAEATEISISFEKTASVEITKAGITAALPALAMCADKVLESWGVDPVVAHSAVVPAEGDPLASFNYDDYPEAALRTGEQGQSVIFWKIDIDGTAKDCRVMVSSKSKLLDNASCAIVLKRAHYKPARNKDGKPVISYESRSINWTVLPS